MTNLRFGNRLDDMTSEQVGAFFELYHIQCEKNQETPSLKDFVLWYEERYGE